MAEHNVMTRSSDISRGDIGKHGEEIARKYLEDKGYGILEQNYRTKRAEIDIIAREHDMLVFVEVRTKHHEQFGSPEETLNYKKRMKILRNAGAYVARVKHQGPYRIDAVCVVLNQQQKVERIAHYENIV